MLGKQQTFTTLVISSKELHMLFQDILVIHGCGIVCESVVGLMEVFVTLILIQVHLYVLCLYGDFDDT